jgi:hypothetical protein
MGSVDYNVNPEVKGMHLVEIKIKGKIDEGGCQREGFIYSFKVVVFKLIYLVFMSSNLWTSS